MSYRNNVQWALGIEKAPNPVVLWESDQETSGIRIYLYTYIYRDVSNIYI